MKKETITIINFMAGNPGGVTYITYDVDEKGIKYLVTDGVDELGTDMCRCVESLWDIIKDSSIIWIEVNPVFSGGLIYPLFTVLNWYKKYCMNGRIVGPRSTIKYIDTFGANYGVSDITLDSKVLNDHYEEFKNNSTIMF